MTLAETRGGSAFSRRNGQRVYLLVFEGDSTRTVPLTDGALLFVGRAPECAVCVSDESVSRKHAAITLHNGTLSVRDLESHNGTIVNGRAVTEAVLAPGDSVAIGDCTMVVHCGASAPARRSVQPLSVLRERLDAEIERALESERSFCVACFHFTAGDRAESEATLSRELRLMDVAAWSEEGLLVMLPELEPRDAGPAVERIADALRRFDTAVRAGFALFPADGADADSLLLGARQAVGAAPEGGLASAATSGRELRLGTRPITLVADPAMLRVYELIERLAKATLPVLVLGETGAGKENAAYAVHHFSPRAAGPFVSLNSAAVPESLLESELFGYEKGAFSGANVSKPGLFEAADGGTLFLDEVGELSLSAQARLLRALETRSVMRVGGLKERPVNLRVVAATHRDLGEDVKAGRFRQDLLFRIGAATVTLPPLRERPRELALLARHFVEAASATAGREAPVLSARTVVSLMAHSWPGNVRELKNAIDFAVATLPPAQVVIEPWSLPASVGATQPGTTVDAAPPQQAKLGFRPLAFELRELEALRIREALEAASGNQTRAAELISMPRRTFVLRLRELRLAESPPAPLVDRG